MALSLTFRPLTAWPGPRSQARRRAPFRSTYQSTLELLETELGRLRARSIVIEAGFAPFEIRNDGWPRSNARPPSDPGVILSFESIHGPLSYPCDRFSGWQDNLRAIALSLQALRAVDRYGVTRRAEQYRGWTQLPPAAPAAAVEFPTREAAAIWLASVSGIPKDYLLLDAEALERGYRIAARKLHPDQGGNHEEFVRLQAAKRILGGRHG